MKKVNEIQDFLERRANALCGNVGGRINLSKAYPYIKPEDYVRIQTPLYEKYSKYFPLLKGLPEAHLLKIENEFRRFLKNPHILGEWLVNYEDIILRYVSSVYCDSMPATIKGLKELTDIDLKQNGLAAYSLKWVGGLAGIPADRDFVVFDRIDHSKFKTFSYSRFYLDAFGWFCQGGFKYFNF